MAARRRTSQEAGDDSSSSSGEDLERFREAAWEPPGLVKKTEQKSAAPVPSLRVQPESHDHDGNELETTPEFRNHVAKKLAAMLESCIKEIPASRSLGHKCTAASDSEDEGFRLLTTSVPGNSGKISPSPALKRRVASSTSEDSEEEKQRRCREAAVSGFDILRHGALQTTPVDILDTTNTKSPEKKKKKKKKKAKKESEMSDESEKESQHIEFEDKINGFKKKKKKKSAKSDEAQSDDQTIHPESKSECKKSKTKTYVVSKMPETEKDGSKKKKKESYSEITSDHSTNQMCGNSGTKKKESGCGRF